MTYKTTGTLKEIGAKVGDVVRSGIGNEFEVWQLAIESFSANDYTIISRATPEGPVRTATRKEIVPGVYGAMKISGVDDSGVNIDIIDILDQNNIDDAIATLTEIRDAL